MTIHDYSTGTEPTGETWDTETLQRDFTVLAFLAPFMVVRRKSDGVQGTLEFKHQPRIYFDFRPD
jgi:hypothetical protein